MSATVHGNANAPVPTAALRAAIDETALHARFAAVVGAKNAIVSPSELRTYECDGLLGYRVRPQIVVLPGSTEEVAGCVKVRARAGHAGRTARCGDRALRRLAAERRFGRDRALADEEDPRGRSRQPRRARAARRDQPRHHARARRRRLVLRSRSELAERVHDRRQRRGELRRRALPEVRLHGEPRRGPHVGAARRRGRRAGLARRRARVARLRSGRRRRRQRRDDRDRHRGAGARAARAGAGADAVRNVPLDRRSRRRRLAHHRRRDRSGRDRDVRPARDRGDRGGDGRRLAARRRRAAADGRRRRRSGGRRDRRARVRSPARRGRDRDSRAARRSGAAARVEGPQVRVRGDGPHLAELPRAGRRDPAQGHRAGAARDRGARRERRFADRERVPCRRRQPAPAGAVRRPHPRAGAGRGARRGRDPARLLALRRLGDRRARRRPRQGVLPGRAVQRRRSRDDADRAHDVRSRSALQPAQDVPDAAAVRRQARRVRRAPAEASGEAGRG